MTRGAAPERRFDATAIKANRKSERSNATAPRLPAFAFQSLVIAAGLQGALYAQGDSRHASVERFLAALEARRQSVRSARFVTSGRIIYTAQSRQNFEAAGRFYPERDVIGELRELTVLDFERNRFRQDYGGLELFVDQDGIGKPATVRRVHTFDGNDLYTLKPRNNENERLYRDAPPGLAEAVQWDIKKTNKKMPASIFFFASYPKLFSCGRLPQPLVNYRIDARPRYATADFKYRGEVAIAGIRCAVFRWVRPPVSSDYVELCADSEDLSRIVRWQRVSDGHYTYDLEVHYDSSSRIPSGWVFRDFDNPNPRRANKLVKEIDYRVGAAEINQAVTDSDFAPDLSPGMLVSTKDGVFPVASDGRSLIRPPTRSRYWKYFLAGILVALFLGFAFLCRRRLMRRRAGRGNLASPSS